MAHDNRDIAQEGAEDFLTTEIWELVEDVYAAMQWNEMYVIKTSKRDRFKRIVRTHLAAYEAKKGMKEFLQKNMAPMGSFCLFVKRKPQEIYHIWNLPLEKEGSLIIPDGKASNLILDSVARLPKGNLRHIPRSYASMGQGK